MITIIIIIMLTETYLEPAGTSTMELFPIWKKLAILNLLVV